MTPHRTPSLQDDARSSNPVITSTIAQRPDFLGEIDENRLIGRFRDDFTEGDKLALKNFIAREFGLEQLEVLLDAADVLAVVERHEAMRTQIDLLCIDLAVARDCEDAVFARLLSQLSTIGIVCVESGGDSEQIDANLLSEYAFKTVMVGCGLSVFAHIQGERSPRSVSYQIDMFLRKRYVKRKQMARLAGEPKIPEVAVFVLTYKHEAFIAECLRSVMMQRGHFTMRVLIIDDASPDNTASVVRSIIEENRDEHIKIELRVNPRNVGASANWGPALSWAEGADYVTFTDGDDFWNSQDRVQKHIDFMREHPDVLLSFNSFEFCAIDGSGRRRGIHLDTPIVSAERLVKDNPVGHLGATFYRGEIVEVFPLEPFYYINGDWMINIYCSQIGGIGYLDDELSVYRLHEGGVWSLTEGSDRILRTIDVILRYNAFTDYNYNAYFNWLLNGNYAALSAFLVDPADDAGKVDLIIIMDEFPAKGEFKYAEVTYYLNEFPSALILSTLDGNYQRRYPEIGSRIVQPNGTFPLNVGKLVYVATLKETFAVLAEVEAACVPFVFTLSSEDGLAFNDPNIDMQMKRVFRSQCFQSVVVTQQNIYDYIIRKDLCRAENIALIPGGVMPEIPEGRSISKRRWRFNKTRLDVCFIALKVAPFDKKHPGYKEFVEVAKALTAVHDDICFHVVGPLSPTAINVVSLGDRIKFYGSLKSDKLESLFDEMDIVLSPNFNGNSSPRITDSFPTGRCIEAGAHGIAIFTTDVCGSANDRFTDGEDIVLMKPVVGEIVAKIVRYYADPEGLKTIGESGAKTIRKHYCPETQMVPRINLLREAIRNPIPVTQMPALEVKMAAMRTELAHLEEQLLSLAKKKRKLSLLLRGLRRFLTGRSNTTAKEMFHVFRSAGFRGLRRTLRDIGS